MILTGYISGTCLCSLLNDICCMFLDTKGLASFKQLRAPEYSAVELQLRHKYYGLAASYALLKYVEYIKNVLYAPKSLKVEFQVLSTTSVFCLSILKFHLLMNFFNKRRPNNY